LRQAARQLARDFISKRESALPQTILTLSTRGQGLYEFTGEAEAFVSASGREEGLLTVFVRHTSCSLLIQENADPDVQKDLVTFFAKIAPRGGAYVHDAEGPDDMPSHIRSALTQVSLGVPVRGGKLALGQWQGLYLFEHRDRPHQRQVQLHVIGEGATASKS
jgi:secondary thiamine-phosphate synthase enzyme